MLAAGEWRSSAASVFLPRPRGGRGKEWERARPLLTRRRGRALSANGASRDVLDGRLSRIDLGSARGGARRFEEDPLEGLPAVAAGVVVDPAAIDRAPGDGATERRRPQPTRQ